MKPIIAVIALILSFSVSAYDSPKIPEGRIRLDDNLFYAYGYISSGISFANPRVNSGLFWRIQLLRNSETSKANGHFERELKDISSGFAALFPVTQDGKRIKSLPPVRINDTNLIALRKDYLEAFRKYDKHRDDPKLLDALRDPKFTGAKQKECQGRL